MTKDTINRAEIGRKGGQARSAEHTPEELSQQVKQGAQTVEEKHPGFHSEIGRKSGQNRADKYSHEELSIQA